MKRYELVVAALLLTIVAGVATAAENTGQRSKNARKLLIVLNSLGINSPDVQEFVADVDSRINKGYFMLAEKEVMGGDVALRYGTNKKPGMSRLELAYTPKDSKVECIANTHGVMVSYDLKF